MEESRKNTPATKPSKKYTSLIERLERKRDEFLRIGDSSHQLLNIYYDGILKEIEDQSAIVYNLISEHFNNLMYIIEDVRKHNLNIIPNEGLDTNMLITAEKIDDLFNTTPISLKNCLSILREEQNISTIITKKLNEYLDFKKILLTPIKKDLDLNETFGSLYEKDNFHMRVPVQKFNFLSVCSDGTIKSWMTNKAESIKSIKKAEKINFSKLINGNRSLLTIGEDIILWDMKDFVIIFSFPVLNNKICCYKLSSDDKLLTCFDDGTVKFWDLVKPRLIYDIKAHEDSILTVKVVLNKYFLTGCKDSTIKLWALKSGNLVRTFSGHVRAIIKIKVLSHQKFVSCSEDKSIKIWDRNTGECVRTLIGHENKVTCMKLIQPKKLITGSLDSTIKFWDLESGREEATLKGHKNGINYLKAILNTNKLISSGADFRIKIWTLTEGTCLQTFKGHENFILDVKILPIGLFLSASADSTIKIWNLESKKYLASYNGHENDVINVHFLF